MRPTLLLACLAFATALPAFGQGDAQPLPPAAIESAASSGADAAAPAPAPRRTSKAPPAAARSTHGHRRAASHVRDDAEPDSYVYGHRPDVLAYAAQVADERGLDLEWVQAQLASARYQPSVARLVMPPAHGNAKNWAAYRARFVDARHLRTGGAWWQAHEQALDDAQARYGVPASVIAAIVGVETSWGQITGRYRVLDALATLAFDFPSGRSDRSAFYRAELRAYLTWCALEGRDADSVHGSYAGAIGWPQFMPSSILRYAVDFDHDGRVDLADGGPDVIGSIANFLALQGWQPGRPARYGVVPPADPVERAQLLAPDIRPTFSAAQMQAAGAGLPDVARDEPGPLALVKLDNGAAAPTYVAGAGNFYVVTRYNWSSYYAMAVLDLAEALQREHAAAGGAELQAAALAPAGSPRPTSAP